MWLAITASLLERFMNKWEFPSTITASMHFDRVNCWNTKDKRIYNSYPKPLCQIIIHAKNLLWSSLLQGHKQKHWKDIVFWFWTAQTCPFLTCLEKQHMAGQVSSVQFSSVQSLSRVRLFVTPWITEESKRKEELLLEDGMELGKQKEIWSFFINMMIDLCSSWPR